MRKNYITIYLLFVSCEVCTFGLYYILWVIYDDKRVCMHTACLVRASLHAKMAWKTVILAVSVFFLSNAPEVQ